MGFCSGAVSPEAVSKIGLVEMPSHFMSASVRIYHEREKTRKKDNLHFALSMFRDGFVRSASVAGDQGDSFISSR
jgi:hypothetical protein